MIQIPPALLDTAYIYHDEPAWQRTDAIKVIEWATRLRIGVFGGEIWLATTPGPTIPTPYIYAFDTPPSQGEHWDHYVERANSVAASYVANFEWHEADTTHHASIPYFNLTLDDHL